MFRLKQFRKLYYALIVFIIICLLGVLGFSFIEGYTISEAIYMTIITVSTVGFQEVRPLTDSGRFFTSILILTSFGTFAYVASVFSNYLSDGELRRHFTRLKKMKKINKLENHIIICGFGRNGKQILHEIESSHMPYIIIEHAHDIVEELSMSNKNYIEGDATDDKVLINAGINRAKALVTTLPDDAENVFVVLTAREMNPQLLIISRASKDSSDKKLRMAGANNVVMPDKVGGTHMASLVIKPDVVEFFNHLTGQDNNISIEEITYESLPKEFKNKSIADLEIRKRSGANIVGLKTEEGEYILNPAPETIINEGTKLFVLGMVNQIEDLLKWE
ncbi:MAG: NAD-binding protein [Flavobacteriales bacterium]|nr:NAD-binding protein [Flavobacteriales bacterium]